MKNKKGEHYQGNGLSVSSWIGIVAIAILFIVAVVLVSFIVFNIYSQKYNTPTLSEDDLDDASINDVNEVLDDGLDSDLDSDLEDSDDEVLDDLEEEDSSSDDVSSSSQIPALPN